MSLRAVFLSEHTFLSYPDLSTLPKRGPPLSPYFLILETIESWDIFIKTKCLDIGEIRECAKLQLFVTTTSAKICQNSFYGFLSFTIFGQKWHQNSNLTWSAQHNLGMIFLFNFISFLSGHSFCFKFVFQFFYQIQLCHNTVTSWNHSTTCRRPFQQSLFLLVRNIVFFPWKRVPLKVQYFFPVAKPSGPRTVRVVGGCGVGGEQFVKANHMCLVNFSFKVIFGVGSTFPNSHTIPFCLTLAIWISFGVESNALKLSPFL